jgi:sn-glycerol 3-phosphate transport system substrate-binding protein
MKRSLWSVLCILVVLSMMLAACGTPAAQPPAQTGGQQPAATTAPAAAATTAPAAGATAAAPTATVAPTPTGAPVPEGAVKIDFWHSMSGDIGGTAIPKLAYDFNTSQQKCYVTPTYQGSYDDSLNKLKAGLQSKAIPAVVQLFDIGTRLLVDLKVATPVQDFIDKEKYDVSDLEPNVLAYYTVDGKQWSMPFNSSNPMLYYNKDMFKQAGLDPEKPPRTWAEFEDAARKLTVKDANGKVTRPGAVFAIYGWFFEQLLAVSGGYYADNENGRAAPATKATFNSPEGVAVLDWWKKMADEGTMGNLGRKTVDTRNAFMAGQTAMIIESTATLRGMMDTAKGKFDLGTAFLPRPNEEAYNKAGTVIGGASVWILKDRPAEEQQCAWEFIKFVSAPPQQAYWHTKSGYYPIRKAAYDEPLDKEWRAKYPQFQTAIDQLHAAPNNRYTQGGLIGVFPTARQTIEGAIEEVLAGKSTPQQALDKAAQSVTAAIEDYNLTMGIK